MWLLACSSHVFGLVLRLNSSMKGKTCGNSVLETGEPVLKQEVPGKARQGQQVAGRRGSTTSNVKIRVESSVLKI
jgi:hypothetical protein